MKARLAGYAMVLLSGAVLADAARAECNCLYNNQRYEQEDTVCMRTPQGMRMARCGMLDNIAWWEMLDEPCPGPGVAADDAYAAPVYAALAYTARGRSRTPGRSFVQLSLPGSA
jgi:hypothetical protein